MKRTAKLVGTTLFMLSMLLMISISHKFGVSTLYAQNSSIVCTNSQISPVENTSTINTLSILSTKNGDIFYLIPADEQETQSHLFHMLADGTINQLGTFPIVQGVYSTPQWWLDEARNSILFFTSTGQNDWINSGLDMLNYQTGEQTTLVSQANGFGFELLESERLITWHEGSGSLVFYNVETGERSTITVPVNPAGYLNARIVRTLPDNNVLFMNITHGDDGYIETAHFYLASRETGQSQQLHQDDFGIMQSSDALERTLLLENSLIYINEAGVLKEIAFDGTLLRELPLQGEGIYDEIQQTAHGIIYKLRIFQDNTLVSSDLYYVSDANVVTKISPDTANADGMNPAPLPSAVTIVTNAQGQEQLWFSMENAVDYETGTLYAFSIAADGIPSQIFTMNDVRGLEASPTGNYIIANQQRQAILISTQTLSVFGSFGDYYGNRIFTPNAEKVYFSEGMNLSAYTFATGERQSIFVSQNESPSIFFADYEKGLLYFYDTIIPESDPLGTRNIYVSGFDGTAPIQVNLADQAIPRDTHMRGFYQTATNDILYFNTDYTTLFRAVCQANPA